MGRDSGVVGFLRELAARVVAAVVVVGLFYGVGDVDRTDAFGLSALLGTRAGFFGAAFGLVGLATVGWFALQRWRG